MEWIVNWLMVFLRASAMLAIFPIFSASNMPVRVRLALGGLLAYFIGPALPVPPVPHDSMIALVGLMSMEVLVGLILGFAARMVFYAMDIAGAIMSAEMGLVLSTTVNPFNGGRVPLISTLLYYLTAILWLSLDMHHELLVGFLRSYDYLPVGGASLSDALMGEMIQRTSYLFVLALQMAAPMMAVAFIITLVFAVLSRAVPQMNVFILSFGARALAGLIVFSLVCNLIGQHIISYLGRLPQDVLLVAQLLGFNS